MSEKKCTTVSKKALFDALQCLRDNVLPSDLAECSTFAIFSNGRVCAMNDSVAVSVPIDCGIDGVSVELQLLYDCVRKMPDKELLMGLANGDVLIKGKNSAAKFAVRDDIVFDESFVNLSVQDFTRLPETFAEALNFTGFATDPQEAAYNRCVIYNGYMYAMSSYRCAKYDMGDEARELFPEMTFVTPECMGFVNKMRPQKYLVSDGYLHLYDNDMRIYSARTRTDTNFDTELADSFVAIPDSPSFRLPPNFSEVIERCNPFSGKTAKVKKVNIDIRGGELNIVATREDNSRYKETVRGVQCTTPLNFTVNLKLLSDMVKLCEEYRLDDERLVGTAAMYQCMCPLTED